jgi:lysophospholipase L1-like esterase
MKNTLATAKGFWRDAALILLSLAALLVFAWVAPAIYTSRLGRFPATMLAVARSRAVLDNAGVTGYYERLFEATPQQQANRLSYSRIFDPYRLTRIRPHADSSINRFGFFGPEYSLPKPPNTRRIALLGDSLTQGAYIRFDKTYGCLLQDRMNATLRNDGYQRYEIVNLAVGGYEITQILDVALVDAPRFEPDVFVLALTELSVCRNWDVHLVQLIQRGFDPKYDFLRDVIRQAGAAKDDDSLTLFAKLAPYRIPVLRESLIRMKTQAALEHATFIVVLLPSVEEGNLCQKRFDGIPELLASLNIPVIDVLDTFQGVLNLDSLRTDPRDVHPSAKGHAMIFENLYARLTARSEIWESLTGAPQRGQTPQSK